MDMKSKENTSKESINKTIENTDILTVTQKPDLSGSISQKSRDDLALIVWQSAIFDYKENWQDLMFLGGWDKHAEYIANLCKETSNKIGLSGVWTVTIWYPEFQSGTALNSNTDAFLSPRTATWSDVMAQGSLV
ncbi:hypothetical protein [Photobacterium atrarenae]|uniref:Uncharacterized protein n=1 Tax=Photobacterium atrarenae TaxID=865757 RepID=A0ABY5GNQ9_9GAMM|nr:hypothetical protein [Photobacterium atrarenae]UTV30994.1 hypothetical protein NNL38_24640 [Photobacterium atrarenae]